MSGPQRRFWRQVETVPDGDGFLVALDGKPVRLGPAGPLRVVRQALADAIAEEWSQAGGGATGGSYSPDALGLTRLAGTLQGRVAIDRPAFIDTLLEFLHGETLCYRADRPAALAERQQAGWQPWLDWARTHLGVALAVGEGVMPRPQPADAVAAMRAALERQDDAALTALGVLTPLGGSLVLGLAVVDGALEAAAAHRLALLDETFQAEQWGTDAQAAARRDAMLRDFVEAERFVALARPPAATRLLISGRVQGVGYRDWLRQAAIAAGVEGWTRNLSDGRVEALLCGPEAACASLVARAWTGPALARVDAIDVSAQHRRPETHGFVIRPTATQPGNG